MKIVQHKDQKYLMCAHGFTTKISPDCEIVISSPCYAILRCSNKYYFVTEKGPDDWLFVPIPQEVVQKITARDRTAIDDILTSTELYEHGKKENC